MILFSVIILRTAWKFLFKLIMFIATRIVMKSDVSVPFVSDTSETLNKESSKQVSESIGETESKTAVPSTESESRDEASAAPPGESETKRPENGEGEESSENHEGTAGERSEVALETDTKREDGQYRF